MSCISAQLTCVGWSNWGNTGNTGNTTRLPNWESRMGLSMLQKPLLSIVSSPHQESNSWPSVKTALTAGGTYRRCLGNCEIVRGVGRVRPGTWNKPCWEWWVMVSWWFQEIGDPTTQRWLAVISFRDGSCSSKKCATAEVMLRTAGQMAVFHWPWLQLVDHKDIGWFHGKNGEKAWKSKINWGLW